MSRALIIVNGDADRQRAMHWAKRAPLGTRIEWKEPRRSIPQSDKMWAMLSELAMQLPWHGIKLRPDDYKLLMLDALKREVRMVPNIDGNGMVSLGRSSSDLSKEEMSDLLELIGAFGAQHGVVFHDGGHADAA
ncbi:MAG: recombination protein NinB [Planctomycetota bacterium]